MGSGTLPSPHHAGLQRVVYHSEEYIQPHQYDGVCQRPLCIPDAGMGYERKDTEPHSISQETLLARVSGSKDALG